MALLPNVRLLSVLVTLLGVMHDPTFVNGSPTPSACNIFPRSVFRTLAEGHWHRTQKGNMCPHTTVFETPDEVAAGTITIYAKATDGGGALFAGTHSNVRERYHKTIKLRAGDKLEQPITIQMSVASAIYIAVEPADADSVFEVKYTTGTIGELTPEEKITTDSTVHIIDNYFLCGYCEQHVTLIHLPS